MDHFKDAHYFPLPSQGNVYTFSHFELPNGCNKLLVGILKREVYLFEYQETTNGALKPTLKEIPFTYIPAGAEIIALDVFNRSEDKHDFVISIAIVKNNSETNSMESFLNIYSEGEETAELNLESMAQNCFNIELNFIPYHLTNVQLPIWKDNEILSNEMLVVLTGGDNQIHFYRDCKAIHGYKEADIKEYFPEFYSPPSVINWVDFFYFEDNKCRMTVFGCECGYMRMVRVNVVTKEIMFNFSTKFVNSITCVKLYPERELADKLLEVPTDIAEKYDSKDGLIINLVCVNSLLPSVMFRDVSRYGLQKYDTLRRLDTTSVNSCCESADINFDGIKEILIGSSCEEIAMYQYDKVGGFKFEEEKKVVSPVLGVKYIDITGDGLRELIVFTLKGVYIYQYDHKYIEEIVKERINNMAIPDIPE